MSTDKVFDRSALDSLAEQVGDRIAVHFAEQFLELLPSRVTKIRHALEAEDGAAALDSALSLKVTATTVGAEELSSCALAVEEFVRSGDLRAASSEGAGLAERAAAVAAAVAAYIESAGCPD